jgi:hypothetical protein
MAWLSIRRRPPTRRHRLVAVTLASLLVLGGSGLATARDTTEHGGFGRWRVDPNLLDLAAVRMVSARFRDLDQALAEGYVEFYKCTEEPGVGTMGQHFANLAYVADPAINPLRPEVLVYEPNRRGGFDLVAIEYVVVAADWHAAFGNDVTPTVLGKDMLFREAGNRYGLPDFYERHAWLFKWNPRGLFDDWNPRVSCRGTGDGGG